MILPVLLHSSILSKQSQGTRIHNSINTSTQNLPFPPNFLSHQTNYHRKNIHHKHMRTRTHIERGRERERRARKGVWPDVQAFSTGFLISSDHLLSRRPVGLRVIHDNEPVVVIAPFEQYRIGVHLLVLVVVVRRRSSRRERGRPERPRMEEEGPGFRVRCRRLYWGGAIEQRRGRRVWKWQCRGCRKSAMEVWEGAEGSADSKRAQRHGWFCWCRRTTNERLC